MAVAVAGRLGQSTEDYLKAIFELQEHDGLVSTSGVADALDVSPAAVTKALRQLADKKLIHYKPYRGVSLTEQGRMAALEIIRHHRLLEVFLHDVLGYSWDEVDAEAEHLEHHISEAFEERIERLLNYPTVDPHGDPIPSRDGKVAGRRGKSLADCEPGETVAVLRVRDSDPKVLQYLGRLGMRPGTVLEVIEKHPFGGPLTLGIDPEVHSVGRELSGQVFVEAYVAG